MKKLMMMVVLMSITFFVYGASASADRVALCFDMSVIDDGISNNIPRRCVEMAHPVVDQPFEYFWYTKMYADSIGVAARGLTAFEQETFAYIEKLEKLFFQMRSVIYEKDREIERLNKLVAELKGERNAALTEAERANKEAERAKGQASMNRAMDRWRAQDASRRAEEEAAAREAERVQRDIDQKMIEFRLREISEAIQNSN